MRSSSSHPLLSTNTFDPSRASRHFFCSHGSKSACFDRSNELCLRMDKLSSGSGQPCTFPLPTCLCGVRHATFPCTWNKPVSSLKLRFSLTVLLNFVYGLTSRSPVPGSHSLPWRQTLYFSMHVDFVVLARKLMLLDRSKEFRLGTDKIVFQLRPVLHSPSAHSLSWRQTCYMFNFGKVRRFRDCKRRAMFSV